MRREAEYDEFLFESVIIEDQVAPVGCRSDLVIGRGRCSSAVYVQDFPLILQCVSILPFEIPPRDPGQPIRIQASGSTANQMNLVEQQETARNDRVSKCNCISRIRWLVACVIY